MQAWGIAGSAGMEAQVRALGTALGVKPEMKNIALCPSISWLPNACFVPFKSLIVPALLGSKSERPAPPWPDLVISCGRRSAQAAMGLKPYLARKGAKTRFIHIQDPQVNPAHFDLVVAMEHDTVRGGNVLVTHFALHDITPASLAQAAAQFEPRFAKYDKPRVAVLIGGSTNKYRFTPVAMRKLVAALETLLARTQASLLITTSRRTGTENTALLKAAFADKKRAYIYDGGDENPYRGLLALADVIIVTNDSVNMMSEAHATGKPLYILKLEGHADTKPARFAESLLDEGIARLPGEQLDYWSYPANAEMPRLAAEIRRRLSLA